MALRDAGRILGVVCLLLAAGCTIGPKPEDPGSPDSDLPGDTGLPGDVGGFDATTDVADDTKTADSQPVDAPFDSGAIDTGAIDAPFDGDGSADAADAVDAPTDDAPDGGDGATDALEGG